VVWQQAEPNEEIAEVGVTTAVLDRPVNLGLEEFAVACALQEIFKDRALCDREATLTIRMHGCQTTVSCEKCWNELIQAMKNRERGQLIVWSCSECGVTAKSFRQLMWAEPL
jgi:hypothetical protein